MQATLDALPLKVLTRALTCLSKYGDELSIYATTESLSLSSTNSTKSAYCRFKYGRQFFSRYRLANFSVSETGSDSEKEVQNVTGQLTTKSFLSILKHRTVEKSVERCELSIVDGFQGEGDEDEERDTLESKLIVRLHCKHGVVKTHRLLLQTPTTLMAPGIPDNRNESRLVIPPKTLKDLLEHFPVAKGAKSDSQLVWTFGEGDVGLKSMESAVDSRGRGQLSTQISISSGAFDDYDMFETPITISFHLREFTATIAFADSMSLSLEMRFTDSAAPLFIDIQDDSVEALFVISTSHVPGITSASQHTTQNNKNRKHERAQSSETPRQKKYVKAVHPVAAGSDYNRSYHTSRASSHAVGSMPPPSMIPDRGSQPVTQPQRYNSLSSSSRPQKATVPQRAEDEPLFLPSSQMSVEDEEMLRATGLGLESMNAAELAELLEEDGEEVDFSYMSQPPLANSTPHHRLQEPNDDQDNFELDAELSATQANEDGDKTFQPLFED